MSIQPSKFMSRDECFPPEVFQGFMDMIQAPDYAVKERLELHK